MSKGFIIVKKKKQFPNISAQAFAHPLDTAALSTLENIPGIDKLLRILFSLIQEKRSRLYFLSSAVRVSPRQFGRIFDLYSEACVILDISSPPELYVVQTPIPNAFSYGIDRPFIVMNSALLDLLESDEIQAILGHELGHVLAKHMLYYSVLLTIGNLFRIGGLGIPFSNLLIYGFVAALYEWYRKAEFTCDRAALLVTQNIDTCYRMSMKMAGGAHFEDMDIEAFFEQADEYESESGLLQSVYKFLNNWRTTHPHAAARMKELNQWYQSGAYTRILDGRYVTNQEAAVESVVSKWAALYEQLSGDVDRGRDILTELFQELTSTGQSVWDKGSELINSLFKLNKDSKD